MRLLLFILLASCTSLYALDFDGDGISDFGYITPNGSNLDWFAYSSISNSSISLGTLGVLGNHLVPAIWQGISELGVISLDAAGDVNWQVGSRTPLVFGRKNNTVVSGGDFDGNGESDAAYIINGANLRWRIRLNPFGTTPSNKNVTFGKVSDLPFFIDTAGTGDSLALFRKGSRENQIITRSLSGTITKHNIRKYRGSPNPIRLASGVDGVVLVSKSSSRTILSFVSLNPRTLRRVTVPIGGTVVIGDFDSLVGGHEVIVSSSNAAYIVYPTNGAATSHPELATSSIPFDDVNINKITGATSGSSSNNNLPPPGECVDRSPRDGGGGFVWKPNSDTQHWAVAVLPSSLTGFVTQVRILQTNGELITVARNKGAGNGNRTSHILDQIPRHTGSSLRSEFGSIIAEVNLTNGGCYKYSISNPARRVD